MFCKCGYYIKDGANLEICPECGAKLDIAEQAIRPTAEPDKNDSDRGYYFKLIKRLFIIICVLATIAAIIVAGVNAYNFFFNDESDNNVAEEPITVEEYLSEGRLIDDGDDDVYFGDDKVRTNTGEKFSNYLRPSSAYSMASFRLDGNFDKLTGVWFIMKDYKNTENLNQFKVYVDKKLVYTSDTITHGDIPTNIDIDLKYGNMLTIMFTQGFGEAVLGDAKLICTNMANQKNTNKELTPPVWLVSLDYLDCGEVYTSSEWHINNAGDIYSNFIYGCVYDKPEKITYYLDGKYSKISGTWAMFEENKNDESKSKFSIYADGEKVYTSKTMTKGVLPQDFKVSINKCKKLTIKFESGDGSAELGNVVLW